MDNAFAKQHGIPKWLRQYNHRYGRGGVSELLKTHLKYPGPLLNHGRERGEKLRALVMGIQALRERKVIEGVATL